MAVLAVRAVAATFAFRAIRAVDRDRYDSIPESHVTREHLTDTRFALEAEETVQRRAAAVEVDQ